MSPRIILVQILLLSCLPPVSVLGQEGRAIILDGVNDFGSEYLLEIDTLDPPPYADDSLYYAMGIGDASVEDNWNHWIGPDTNLLANPVEVGRLFATNDMFYLYIGVDHTDTDGLPAPGGGFGYWRTQIGVAIDVDSTPTGGNQASWSPSGFTDPWGNNQEFLHDHRPDYMAWFDHVSNDFKLYRWNVEDEGWVELTQDTVDIYHEEYGFRPGYILLQGEDGVAHREGGDPGPFSGPDRFVEFQIPLRAIGVDYPGVVWDSLRAVPVESLPPTISIQVWCTQPGKGAFDVVPSDDQICRYPTMGDWGESGRVTELRNYADYTLLSYRDQVPPDLAFEELATAEVLNSSARGLGHLAVVASITDRVSPLSKSGSVATIREAFIYYSEQAETRVDTVIDTTGTPVDTLIDTSWVLIEPLESYDSEEMVNIEGTELWIADIPDTVFFTIWAEDLGGANVSTAPGFIVDSDTTYMVYAPPDTSRVTWTRSVPEDTTAMIFIPDGTIVIIPGGSLPGGSATVSIPDATTFTEPEVTTFSPPYATSGRIQSIGVFRQIEVGTRRVLPEPAMLMVHYLADQVPEAARSETDRLRIYYWNQESERWTRCGGHPDRDARVVTAEIGDLGIYGLFYDPSVATEISQVIDDVRLDPNPFSPNGDGLYDNLSVQFTLNTDALVTISVYSLEGELVRGLSQEQGFLEGVQNVVWDGRDDSGREVPYGFYVVFIYAKSSITELPIAKFAKGVGVIR